MDFFFFLPCVAIKFVQLHQRGTEVRTLGRKEELSKDRKHNVEGWRERVHLKVHVLKLDRGGGCSTL